MLEIREATSQDVEEVALIHSTTIPYSINSAMGVSRLCNLYHHTLKDPDSLLLVASVDNRVIGFISGTSEFRNLAKGATSNISIGQIFNALRKMSPFKLVVAAVDLILLSRAFQSQGNFYYFSTWGMLPNSHPTAGAALFRELEKRARNTGSQAVVVNVSKGNAKVLQMYHSLGFLPVTKTVSEIILKKQY